MNKYFRAVSVVILAFSSGCIGVAQAADEEDDLIHLNVACVQEGDRVVARHAYPEVPRDRLFRSHGVMCDVAGTCDQVHLRVDMAHNVSAVCPAADSTLRVYLYGGNARDR